jgi:hypothetical protein
MTDAELAAKFMGQALGVLPDAAACTLMHLCWCLEALDDVACVPSWAFHEHVNTGDRPAILFSHTDMPVMRSLDLYREEAHPTGWQ